jgi:hypothetical protein
VSEEKAAFGLRTEEGQIVVVREVEVAIDITALESQVEDLVVGVVRNRREHLRFQR